ncbi:hypothetical protein JOC48_003818 [Aquibacillus albus]|uniref:Uncharacterized protein n=1 Tax=Aquibacillus albus TaxID=1168171 RepID=A0ABS2N553_9BACI|nr:hypothetical protein [Aquibacillus albus]
MVKITATALSKIQDKIKPHLEEEIQPFVRLTMGIG